MSALNGSWKVMFLAAAVVAVACAGEGGGAPEAEVGGVDEELATTEAALTGKVAIGSTLQTTDALNLRSGPGTGYAIRLTIPNGAKVVTVNTTAPQNSFYNVKYNGTIGWAHGSWLKLISSPPSTKFRVPFSLASTQCGGGKCYPTAYFDTDRRGGTWIRRDWSCRTGSNAKTYDQHTGVDYGIGGWAGMDANRQVLAARNGKVIARHDGEYDRCSTGNCGTANYVKLQHPDGKVSVYWHLKKWSVKVQVGQQVSQGQLLGMVGSSGYSTGPHLHFGYHASASAGAADPYKQAGACGGSTASQWCAQGSWGGLPGGSCL